MARLTKEQQCAVKRIYSRDWGGYPKPSYLEFRRSVSQPVLMDDCVIVHWCGMYLGIESDGYTHS